MCGQLTKELHFIKQRAACRSQVRGHRGGGWRGNGGRGRPGACFKCGKMGHWSRECSKKESTQCDRMAVELRTVNSGAGAETEGDD